MTNRTGFCTVGLLGCGSLGRLIAEGIAAGLAGPCQLKAVYDGFAPENARLVASLTGASSCDSLAGLLSHKCAYIVEAASVTALREAAVSVLEGGSSLIALSSGALSDDGFHAAVSLAAGKHGKKVHIPSGALGGLDLAQAAASAGELSVAMTTSKPPGALLGAPALAGRRPSGDRRETVFRGTAREAVAGFPQNVNVVASLSMATVGLDSVTIEICSDPDLKNNTHTFVLSGAFGRARVEIEAVPHASNPKSSALAAHSVLSLLKKIVSPIQIG
jgi:aspartate dehydrogenase